MYCWLVAKADLNIKFIDIAPRSLCSLADIALHECHGNCAIEIHVFKWNSFEVFLRKITSSSAGIARTHPRTHSHRHSGTFFRERLARKRTFCRITRTQSRAKKFIVDEIIHDSDTVTRLNRNWSRKKKFHLSIRVERIVSSVLSSPSGIEFILSNHSLFFGFDEAVSPFNHYNVNE